MIKKVLSIILAMVLLVSAFAVPSFAQDNSDDLLKKEMCIVIGESASDTERFAANKFAEYFKKVSGKTLSIVTDDGEISEFEFVIGSTNRFSYEFTDEIDGSYVIKSIENGIAILGQGNRGTIYGVFGFLEKYLGVKHFTKDLIVTPEKQELILPQSIDEKYNASFEYTETDWLSPHDVEYSIANGLNGNTYRTIPENMGGTVDYIGNFSGQFAHTLARVFCSRDKYFAEHPEYFALNNGERTGSQLCLTNENTYNIVLSEVMDVLEECHNPEASLQILSLTQDDNKFYCECEDCKKIDDENGSHAGTMLTFVNRIAEAVEKAGYENVAIDTFAYQYTRATPTKAVPRKNVIVRLCSIECCFSHTLDDKDCKENAEFMKDLVNWNKICNRLYVWDYTTNYGKTLGIFPDFGVIQKNLQIMVENGVKGVYEEGNYYMSQCNTEFGDLRSYMLSKFMQNPYADYDEVVNPFLEAYYGAGWKNIREFLDIITEASKDTHLLIRTEMVQTLNLSKKDVQKCDALWEKAKEECAENAQLANIKRSEISWRYWKACNYMGEFASIFTRKEENKKLYEDIVESGATRFRESDNLAPLSDELLLRNPEGWGVKDGLAVNIKIFFNKLFFRIRMLFVNISK